MFVLTLKELFRLVFVTLALGYIFSSIAKRPRSLEDLQKRFDFEDLNIAAIIAAPAVILHELGHKFVGMFFGLQTEFFASYFGLAIGVVLKLIGSPLIFFIPGYVYISNATAFQSMIIAAAGPFMNLVLWLGTGLLLKHKHFGHKTMLILYATKRINMILFFFNIIPLPPFDGSKILSGLLGYF